MRKAFLSKSQNPIYMKEKKIDRFDYIKRCKISVHKLNINETTDGKICELYQKFKDS